MTQEEKELLSKDLCGRLPGVKVDVRIKDYKDIKSIDCVKYDTVGTYIRLMDDEKFSIKPYLRSMSSMTEVEKVIYKSLKEDIDEDYCEIIQLPLIDWLNKKMFDYRGLIPKGLALEAPEGMYNTK
jgi:hypothetical protein